MKLLAMVGSLRKDSFNLHLVETMQERYADKFTIEFADIRSLPHYDQDDEANPPAAVRKLHHQVKSADGVILATPEYNWSFPGVLKNALDWLSRGDRPMNGKPTLVVGASNFMMGTIRAQQHLRDVLVSPGIGARMLPPGGNEVLITFAQDKFKDG
ncbi:MAG: NAD(P)H-dependent oxidoreductase, partial [Alicyclobacillus sp.]|nr:NAD(P)H-dependent oxidoreductase [Alicyclobacillus sp.]